MQERRAVCRTKAYLHGEIAFNHRFSTMECVVRNFTSDGAMLGLASNVVIPGRFDLTIRHKGESRIAHLVWRTDRAIGVRWDGVAGGTVISIETARRLKALQRERDILARRVAQLSEAT